MTMHNQKKTGVYVCETCDVVGFLPNTQMRPGDRKGKGATCRYCSEQKLYTLYQGKHTVRYCTGCKAIVIS